MVSYRCRYIWSLKGVYMISYRCRYIGSLIGVGIYGLL